MDLGYQWTGCVHYTQMARPRAIPFARCDAMGAENHSLAFWHFFEVFDKDRALAFKCLEHEPVVHDLMAYIKRRAVGTQGAADGFDGAIDAGTETARFSQDHSFN